MREKKVNSDYFVDLFWAACVFVSSNVQEVITEFDVKTKTKTFSFSKLKRWLMKGNIPCPNKSYVISNKNPQELKMSILKIK